MTVFLVVIYVGFLLAERGSFPQKISAALPDGAAAAKALEVVTEINVQIQRYPAVKTLINLTAVFDRTREAIVCCAYAGGPRQ